MKSQSASLQSCSHLESEICFLTPRGAQPQKSSTFFCSTVFRWISMVGDFGMGGFWKAFVVFLFLKGGATPSHIFALILLM